MIVNSYSKLRVRDLKLMDALGEQLLSLVWDLNEVDIANVVNGYARLSLQHAAGPGCSSTALAQRPDLELGAGLSQAQPCSSLSLSL